ncbi:MAG: hypothetical protein HC904_02295 [Blastochloris sp.]|nr:hypothetical protein [Blastochloris sp.]
MKNTQNQFACLSILMMAAWLGAGLSPLQSQIIYTSGTYTQDFSGLADTGLSVTWTNNSTIAGWHAGQIGGGGTWAGTYAVSSGGTLVPLSNYRGGTDDH